LGFQQQNGDEIDDISENHGDKINAFQLSYGLVFGLPRASFLLYFALAWHSLFRLLTEPSSHGVQDHQLGVFFTLALPFFSPDDIDHQPIFPCWGYYRCLKLLINEYGKKLIH